MDVTSLKQIAQKVRQAYEQSQMSGQNQVRHMHSRISELYNKVSEMQEFSQILTQRINGLQEGSAGAKVNGSQQGAAKGADSVDGRDMGNQLLRRLSDSGGLQQQLINKLQQGLQNGDSVGKGHETFGPMLQSLPKLKIDDDKRLLSVNENGETKPTSNHFSNKA